MVYSVPETVYNFIEQQTGSLMGYPMLFLRFY